MSPEQSEREPFWSKAQVAAMLACVQYYARYGNAADCMKARNTLDKINALPVAAPEAPRAAEPVVWKHDYMGGCPDETQPDARDPECAACRALVAAAPAAKPLSDDDIRKLARSANLPKIMFDTEGFRGALRRFLAAAQGGGDV